MALPPHHRQHLPVHAHHAEEVHVQLVLRILCFGEFYRAGNAEARVVDQHVDVVFLLQNFLHSCGKRFFLCHVGCDMVHAGRALGSSGKLIDRIALFEHGLRRTKANTGRAAGNDAYLFYRHHRSYPLKTSAMTSTASSISAWVCVAMRLVRSRHSCGAAAGGREELT